jgi:hypothetical protein
MLQQEVEYSLEYFNVLSEIYTFVISAQIKYCQMNMKHPFLEQTFLNIAIYNRSIKKFSDSMLMWKRLEALQKEVYGQDCSLLLMTWKNLGICCLGVGQTGQAEKYFEMCKELVTKLGEQTNDQKILLKDKEELASLE